jgi:hypothetical protein
MEEQNMAKAAIVKNYKLSAQGILVIDDNGVGIENVDTGEFIDMKDLLSDFDDRIIKLSISYDEDYSINAE